jgi:hypothetical protein
MAEVCEEYKKWVEEEVLTPIEEWQEQTVEKCKKKKCKKWCLCCNKWFCWLETIFIVVVKWVVVIVGKWVIYTACRIISLILTLILTILNVLGWPVKWLSCIILGDEYVEKLPMRKLKLEVVIVDYDETTLNPCTEFEINERIGYADRILRSRARISVARDGSIKRMYSKALYRIEAKGLGVAGEYLKGIFLLMGRNSWRHLTVYVIGEVQEAGGLHLPLYGCVFMEPGSADTILAHEIGHALLRLGYTYHVDEKDYLMHTPPDERETACGWPKGLPKLTRNERCTMRRSRWLDWSWVPFVP